MPRVTDFYAEIFQHRKGRGMKREKEIENVA